MRTFRTCAVKGQVLGTAHINFFASSQRSIDACSIQWDGDASFGPLLPAVAFDGVLPTLRTHAQLHAVTEFEEWLDACAQQVRRFDQPLLFHALELVSEESRSAPGAQVELTMRLDRGKARVWAELEASPDDARDVVFELVYKVLWDWLVTDGPRTVPRAELVRRFQTQRAHYRAHGIPARSWMRETGRAPFAAWVDSERHGLR
jgi:hypothetical protein